MKRIFTFILAVVVSTFSFAQNTWTGTAGDGKWETAGNWSLGAKPSTTDAVVIGTSVTIDMKLATDADISIAQLTINGSATVVLSHVGAGTGSAPRRLKVTSTSSTAKSLLITSGATLRILASGVATTSYYQLQPSTSSYCEVAGTLILDSPTGNPSGARFEIGTNVEAEILVTGTIRYQNASRTPDSPASASILKMQSGSKFEMARTAGGTLPLGTWNATSTIEYSAMVGSVTFGLAGIAPYTFGNFVWNCPLQTGASTLFSSGLITFAGNVDIISTGTSNIRFSSATASGNAITVNGNLNIQGTSQFYPFNSTTTSSSFLVKGNITVSSVATLGINFAAGGTPKLEVQGNLDCSGTLTTAGTTAGLRMIPAVATAQTLKITTLTPAAAIALLCTNTSHISLASNVTGMKTTTLSASTCLILGNFNYTVANTGNPLGGTTNHVVTNGTGTLTITTVQPSTGILCRIGTTTTSYDPMNIVPLAIADFTVSVKDATAGFTNPAAIPASTLKREWNVVSTSTSARLEFQPDAAAGSAPITPVVGHYVGSAWVESPSVLCDVVMDATCAGFPYAATFTSFSPFGVGQAGGFVSAVLAVELKKVNAYATGKINKVEWSTASEKNMKEYIVERSVDGINAWAAFTSQAAINKEDSKYSVEDASALALSFYRIKSVDRDGKEEMSKIVSVKRETKGKLNIAKTFPNPTIEAVQVDFEVTSNSNVTVTMTDVLGRVVSNKQVQAVEGLNRLDLNLNAMAHGMYILTLQEGNNVVTQRIVKQ